MTRLRPENQISDTITQCADNFLIQQRASVGRATLCGSWVRPGCLPAHHAPLRSMIQVSSRCPGCTGQPRPGPAGGALAGATHERGRSNRCVHRRRSRCGLRARVLPRTSSDAVMVICKMAISVNAYSCRYEQQIIFRNRDHAPGVPAHRGKTATASRQPPSVEQRRIRIHDDVSAVAHPSPLSDDDLERSAVRRGRVAMYVAPRVERRVRDASTAGGAQSHGVREAFTREVALRGGEERVHVDVGHRTA